MSCVPSPVFESEASDIRWLQVLDFGAAPATPRPIARRAAVQPPATPETLFEVLP